MAVSASAVKTVLEEFYTENPGSGAKQAKITDMKRTWQKQLFFILDRKAAYPNIKKDFKKKFSLEKMPEKESELTPEQLKWFEVEIQKKERGFKHVTDTAIDVGVAKVVPPTLKKKLYDKLSEKCKVLPEQGEKYDNVKPEDATCFHCT
jgi:hypothetical protein